MPPTAASVFGAPLNQRPVAATTGAATHPGPRVRLIPESATGGGHGRRCHSPRATVRVRTMEASHSLGGLPPASIRGPTGSGAPRTTQQVTMLGSGSGSRPARVGAPNDPAGHDARVGRRIATGQGRRRPIPAGGPVRRCRSMTYPVTNTRWSAGIRTCWVTLPHADGPRSPAQCPVSPGRGEQTLPCQHSQTSGWACHSFRTSGLFERPRLRMKVSSL